MKKYLHLFFLLTLFSYMGCGNSATEEKIEEAEIVQFALQYNGSYYNGQIDQAARTIRIGSITEAGAITGVNYRVSGGAVVSPEPREITVWKKEQTFTVTSPLNKTATYTLFLPDLKEAAPPAPPAKVIIGYLPASDWEFESRFDKISWQYLTHINVSFALAKSDGTLNTGRLPDDRLKRIIGKAKETGVKVLISVARNGAGEFTSAIADETSRNALAENIVAFTRKYGFDGFDIDYEEYNGANGETNWNNNIQSLVAFVKKLHAIKDSEMLMTCAVVSNWLNYTQEWQQYFDYINVMSYDHGSFSSTPAQHASYDSFVNDLNYWATQYGTPKTKIVGGLPFYGYSWDEGVKVDDVRAIRFHQIISAFNGKNNLTAEDIANNDNVSKTYYNGRATIGRKCEYVQDNNFGGVMIWQLFQDADQENLQLIKVVGEKISKP